MTRAAGAGTSDSGAASREPELFGAWERFVGAGDDGALAPFTIPGHKRRGGSVSPALRRLLDADVPLYGGLDTVGLTAGVLAAAEAAAARYWGADRLRFVTGGSTQANQITTLAVGAPGDTVLVARTAHRSVVSGLVLAGLRPVWLSTDVDAATGLPLGVTPATVAAAMAEKPDAVGVFLVEPSYVGTTTPLAETVALCHARGVAVVVDQAWGAHFGAHPAVPASALALGADAVVFSAHKTLPAWSQGAVVAIRGGRIDADRLDRAVSALESTSPAGAILASLDASRWLLETRGETLLGALIDTVAGVRAAWAAEGVVTAAVDDPLKLVLRCAPSGLDGRAVERSLIARGMPVEQADRDTVVAMVGLLDDDHTLARLRDAVLGFAAEAQRRGERAPRPVHPAPHWTLPPPPQRLTPREAFFAPHRIVAAAHAVGEVSAETVTPYPPGVPLLVPGEQITAATLAALHAARAAGTRVAYAADPTLATFQVVATP